MLQPLANRNMTTKLKKQVHTHSKGRYSLWGENIPLNNRVDGAADCCANIHSLTPQIFSTNYLRLLIGMKQWNMQLN